jgi:hypothetical protein
MLPLIVLLTVSVKSATADVTALSGPATAQIETQGKSHYMVTRSRTFELTQFADHEVVRTALVEAEVSHRHMLSEDLGAAGDETGTIALTVYPVTSSGQFGSPLATRTLPGDAVSIQGSAGAKVTAYGCCVESNAETQLNLGTLKTIYVKSSAMPLLTYTRLGKPSAVSRTLSVYLAMTPADTAVLGADPAAVAVITWASDYRPIQRVMVRLKSAQPRTDALDWENTVGWRVGSSPLDDHTVFDPAKPTSPVFVWQIDDGKQIEIPLVGDRLDLPAAKAPKGITLTDLGD